MVFKVNEGRPNVVDLIKSGKVHLIINTPLGRASFYDEQSIRRAAMQYSVPSITNDDRANAATKAIEGIKVKCWRFEVCRNTIISTDRRITSHKDSPRIQA